MKNIKVKQRKDNYLMVLASIMMIVAIVMGGYFPTGIT